MIGGRSYQALGPHYVLAPDNCSAILVSSAYELPIARGPPEPSGAGLSADRYGCPANCNSCQT